jgi:ribosome-binding ATPase YchF (GTP1/OBG family)
VVAASPSDRKTADEWSRELGSYSSVGIVGMPNVGKSCLFNTLVGRQLAESANFPFCTIDPNVARVSVPDERLERLASIANSAKITTSQLTFTDIAGLVKGASQGAGLGNRFLNNIREVSVILHVVRCFEDEVVAHVENTINPMRDIEL